MIKVYLGNDTYEYHLMSGKIISLTNMELKELLYESLKKKVEEEKSNNFDFDIKDKI